MLSVAELIVKVLDAAGSNIEAYDQEPEVTEYAQIVKNRYSELKRKHDFTTAAFMARVEIVQKIIAADFTGVVQSGRTPDSESGG